MIEFFLKIKKLIDYHHRSFLIFLMMGIGTTVIYIGLFSLLWYGFHLNHIIAVTIAYTLAAAFQFTANRNITFKTNQQQSWQQLFRYLILLAINYLISVALLQFFIWSISSPFTGLLVTTVVTPLTGYFLFRNWVFKNLLIRKESI